MASVLHLPLPLERRSPEGLMLTFIEARATIEALDERRRAAGRDLTDNEDREWSDAEARTDAVRDELRRRLRPVLGTVKPEDLARVF